LRDHVVAASLVDLIQASIRVAEEGDISWRESKRRDSRKNLLLPGAAQLHVVAGDQHVRSFLEHCRGCDRKSIAVGKERHVYAPAVLHGAQDDPRTSERFVVGVWGEDQDIGRFGGGCLSHRSTSSCYTSLGHNLHNSGRKRHYSRRPETA